MSSLASNVLNKTITTPSGCSTTLTVNVYTDTILIIINQLNSIGTILTATSSHNLVNSKVTYAVDTVLGRRDDPVVEVMGRQMVEKCGDIERAVNGGQGECRTLLLTVSLRKEGRGEGEKRRGEERRGEERTTAWSVATSLKFIITSCNGL